MACRIAIVSSAKHAGIDENLHLRDALVSMGHKAEIVSYDGGPLACPSDAEGWRDRFDLIVVRTLWGYEHDFDTFTSLVDTIESSGVKSLSSPESLRWNSKKASYLSDLVAAGVPVAPTAVLSASDVARANVPTEALFLQIETGFGSTEPAELSKKLSRGDLVVKPSLGADGHGVSHIQAGDGTALRSAIERASALSDSVLVQPFATSIRTTGEASLICAIGSDAPFSGFPGGATVDIADAPSITVAGRFIKTPGESIMVQERLGGNTRPATAEDVAPAEELSIASRALRAIPGPVAPVIARVDMLNFGAEGCDPAIRLSELEIIEPSFYPEHQESIVTKIANAISNRA